MVGGVRLIGGCGVGVLVRGRIPVTPPDEPREQPREEPREPREEPRGSRDRRHLERSLTVRPAPPCAARMRGYTRRGVDGDGMGWLGGDWCVENG